MANLTPEQLRQLQQMGGMYGDGTFYDEAAQRMYSPLYGNASMAPRNGDVDGAWTPGDPSAYWGYDKAQGTPMTEMNGKGYDIYDPTGQQTGSGTFSGYDGLGGDLSDIAKAMAVVGTVGFGGAALMGAGGLGGAGAGTGLSEMGLAGEGAFGATNAMGGAGAFGPAGTAYYGAGGAGLSELGLAGEGAFTGTNAAGGAATGSGVGGATVLGGAGASSLLKPALTVGSTLLGAKSGADAGKGGGMGADPRMDEFKYGENGVMPLARNLLTQQMTPEAQAGWLEMQKRGRGLLGGPIAPNGFERFYGGK